MSDELRDLRAAVYNLATADWIKRTDEEWYDELWRLLDPVVDARAGHALNTHDAGDYRDPDTGRTEVEAHRFSFEGSTSDLARHLVKDHHAGLGLVEPHAGGFTQGDWTALDDLHRNAH
jgi:hypothetical protein